MPQDITQIPLAERIPALATAVRTLRAQVENAERELAHVTDQLASAEAEVLGKAPGSEGVALSGLIEDNPHAPQAPPTRDTAQGDAVDPATGEGSGGARRAGSESPPSSRTPNKPS